MGPPVSSAGFSFIVCVWSFLFGLSSVFCQDMRERDALCNAKGCYVVYFQRKTFLDSWRDCKDKGGNLATIKRVDEASAISSLLSNVDLRYSRTKVQVWIGLQRQPRQCTNARPLRGYSWTTGDQDTEYTNWLKEDSPNMCSVSRCVAMGYSTTETANNFKWIDGSCSVPVEAYLCYFRYQQMCDSLPSEGAGNVLYNTPFNLQSTVLTHVPFGSVATVPCPGGREDETVLCMLQDDGLAGWSINSPVCVSLQYNWCDDGNGGCEHFCKQTGEQFFCECANGYQLGQDGQSCEIVDACEEAPCEFECLPLFDGYRCTCPEGYMLAPDERGCLDVDECLQSPCEQLCVNAPGTFQCTCRNGFQPGEDSECDDLDECASNPCEHACQNTPGSHVCHCHLGYSPLPEDPSRCQDTDECQIVGTCEQMCVNYEGGFECYCEVGYELMADLYSCQKIGERQDQYIATPAFPWVTRQPPPTVDYDPADYDWTLQQTHPNWPVDTEQSLNWLTDAPKLEDADIIWVTRSPEEGTFESEEPTDHSDPDLSVQWGDLHFETATIPPPTPVPNTTPDWYDDEEEEEETTTASPTLLPTSTVLEGAWNWRVPMITARNKPVDPFIDYKAPSDYSFAAPPDPEEADSDSVTSHPPGAEEEEEEIAKDYEDNTASYKPFFPTQSIPPLDSSGVSNGGVDLDSVQKDKGREQDQSSTWLLVGLLVPICIFVIVMVALGIVYCTRCTSQSRSNKNATTTDCYHWISGAHDKQGSATTPALGVKTHV
ncbi:unnamed protein product [Knipowitschia caucasica]|uniref:CD248 molecule, endosialin a n=1 Tax=Knipowitschia caucasica TaxID=637954 RepID=A0AAV2KRR1_KNICA